MPFKIQNNTLFKYIEEENITTVIIPENVTCIFEDAFESCKNIKEIYLPKTIKIVGIAFENCEALQKIHIPSTIKRITHHTFLSELAKPVQKAWYRLNLDATNILDDEMVVIGSGWYSGVNNSQRWVAPHILPKNIKTVGYVYYAKTKYDLVANYIENMRDYPDEISQTYTKYIRSQRKSVIDNLLVLDYVRILEYYDKLGKITEANFLDEYMKVAKNRKATKCIEFLNDWKNKHSSDELVEIKRNEEIEKTPTSVADWKKIFSYKKKEDGTLAITSYKGQKTKVIVPEKIGNSIVTEIAAEAFASYIWYDTNPYMKYRANIVEVELPYSVTCIGNSAFFACKALKKIIIPNPNTTFGNNAFLYCESLIDITIPKGVKVIGESAFRACIGLTSITLPNEISIIEASAFCDCRSLVSISVPDKVTKIDFSAFAGCTNLSDIRIPESVIFIAKNTFYGCEKLTIHAPAGSYAEQYAKENNIPFVAE